MGFPSPQPNPHRQIVETERFRNELTALHPNQPQRADEFIEAAKITLPVRPEDGKQIESDSKVWFMPMDGTELAIYYAFNQTHVVLLSIDIRPDGDEEYFFDEPDPPEGHHEAYFEGEEDPSEV